MIWPVTENERAILSILVYVLLTAPRHLCIASRNSLIRLLGGERLRQKQRTVEMQSKAAKWNAYDVIAGLHLGS